MFTMITTYGECIFMNFEYSYPSCAVARGRCWDQVSNKWWTA